MSKIQGPKTTYIGAFMDALLMVVGIMIAIPVILVNTIKKINSGKYY